MRIEIQEPWWGAWKKYGWAKGIWGLGLKVDDIEKAIANKEQVEVYNKYFKETYIISPVTAKNCSEKFGWKHTANKKVKLYVLPSNKFRKETANGTSKNSPNKG